MKYDLLLSGGEVIDPGEGIRGRRDVALSAGKVALVAESINKEQARECVDVSGKLVVPGLIDIHGHFLHKFLPWAVDPDQACLSNGVTTAVDAGSSEIGSLRTGTAGKVAVLQFQEGNFTFIDWEGNELKTKQRLVPVLTVHNGKIWEDT